MCLEYFPGHECGNGRPNIPVTSLVKGVMKFVGSCLKIQMRRLEYFLRHDCDDGRPNIPIMKLVKGVTKFVG